MGLCPIVSIILSVHSLSVLPSPTPHIRRMTEDTRFSTVSEIVYLFSSCVHVSSVLQQSTISRPPCLRQFSSIRHMTEDTRFPTVWEIVYLFSSCVHVSSVFQQSTISCPPCLRQFNSIRCRTEGTRFPTLWKIV